MNQLMNGFTPEQLEAMKVQIKEDAFAALIAGSETTAVTISYAFQEVAHNPELQASLINEIDQNKDVLGMKSGDDFNFRHLLNKNEMPVINGLLDRVFEDHSPVPVGFPRIAANDIDHGGVQIKKGDTIVTLYARTGNPFHRGKHACAGRHLAKLEAAMSVLYAFDRVRMEPISTKSSVPSRKPDSFLGAPRDSAPLLRVRLR
jgi:cytochrome P450